MGGEGTSGIIPGLRCGIPAVHRSSPSIHLNEQAAWNRNAFVREISAGPGPGPGPRKTAPGSTAAGWAAGPAGSNVPGKREEANRRRLALVPASQLGEPIRRARGRARSRRVCPLVPVGVQQRRNVWYTGRQAAAGRAAGRGGNKTKQANSTNLVGGGAVDVAPHGLRGEVSRFPGGVTGADSVLVADRRVAAASTLLGKRKMQSANLRRWCGGGESGVVRSIDPTCKARQSKSLRGMEWDGMGWNGMLWDIMDGNTRIESVWFARGCSKLIYRYILRPLCPTPGLCIDTRTNKNNKQSSHASQ